MSMGLEGAFGADALSQAIRQQIAEKLAQQQQQFTNSLALRGADRADKQQQILQAEHEAALAERAALSNEKIGGDIATNLGPGQTVISPNAPLTGRLVSSSYGALVQPDRTLPSTQLSSGMPLAGETGGTAPAVTEKPSVLTGNLRFMGTPAANQSEQTRILRGQLLTDPSLTPQQRMEMQAESVGLKAPSREPVQARDPTADHATNRRFDIANPMPQSENKLMRVEHQDPNTGRMVVEYLTPDEVRQTKTFEKGPGAVTANRLVSAKAVVQTGNDMIKALSDPKLASQLGPAMSRYNNAADFFGNPPKEFATLAGQIESYALANMGVHGMRANNGAEAIKATLGQGRHTPETIIAVIQGLNGFANHLLENEGRGQAAAPPAGAVRKYNPATGKVE